MSRGAAQLCLAFEQALRARLPGLRWRRDDTDPDAPVLHFEDGPPAGRAVRAWFDDDEVTVGIGPYFHSHEDTIEEALEYLADWFGGRLLLYECVTDGRLARCGTLLLESASPADVPAGAETFLATGPWRP